MTGLDRGQALQALTYLVMVFFVGGGVVSARYRRGMRGAAIGLYGIGGALALVWVAVWLFGVRG
jgi:hypothetical protein